MSIRAKMITSNIGVVLFSVLLVAIPVLLMMRGLIMEETNESADDKVVMTCNDMKLFLEKPTNLVNAVDQYATTNQASGRQQMESFFEALLSGETGFSELYYANTVPVKDGGFFYSNDHWNPPADYDQTTRAWFRDAISSSGLHITPFMDMVTGKPVAAMSRRVKIGDIVNGVVSIDIKLDNLTDRIADVKLSKSGESFILTSDGTYLTNKDSGKILKDNFFSEYGLNAYTANFDGGKTFIVLDAKGRYLAGRKISDESGWIFVTTGPSTELFTQLIQSMTTIIILAVITIVAAALIAFALAHSIVKPVSVVDKTINGIASGEADLRKRIDIHSNDEIGSLVNGFNLFTEKLHTIIKDVKSAKETLASGGIKLQEAAQDTGSSIAEILANIESMGNQITNQANSVEQTAGSVNEIASNIQSLEHMIENQSSGVTQASAAVEEMIGNIASVNQSVDKMASSFEELSTHAQNGSQKQDDVNARIEQIEAQSQMLQEANAAISAIAEQTNLLAMNAAIEAAHAGEAGKGFSVVADEIRKLSETSTAQSRTIGDQLNNIKDSIGSVVSASAESSMAFRVVADKIKETDQLVRQIKAAMEEQNEGSRQITEALHSMNDSTSEVRTASAEMTEGNKAILEEVRHMQDAAGEMKTSMQEMSIGAKKINETGVYLNEVSSQMEIAIDAIGNQIDLFQV